MIKFYSIESNQIIPIPELSFEKIVWCDALQPLESELNEISTKFNINLDDLKDCLDETERPRFNYDVLLHNNFLLIRTIQDYELFLNRPPTTSLGIFITKNGRIVTIRNSLSLNFDNIIETLNRRKIENNWSLILGILHILITQFDKMSQIIANHIKELQDQILKTQNVGAIQKPFQLNSYVIFFNTAALSNLNAIRAFYHKNKVVFDENAYLLENIDDIITDIEQVYSYSSIYRDLLTNTLDAYASVINNNLSMVMKVVGSISLILMIPTMIASYYGMNVFLPGGNIPGDTTSFFLILIISIAISFLIWIYFRKVNWL